MAQTFGFAAHKIPLPDGATYEQWRLRNREMLARVLHMRTTVAFLGSGCSVALGYPGWEQFAQHMVTEAEKFVTSRRVSTASTLDQLRLQRFARQLASPEQLESGALLYILGACQNMFFEFETEGRAAYFESLRALFERPPDVDRITFNPYDAVAELPIRRFVTSNYDFEMEEALVRTGRATRSEYSLDLGAEDGKSKLSFSQTPDGYEQLALFVMSRYTAAENMVFHCHGSRLDPRSMVVTERDYKEWYLSNSKECEAFRQSLDLLFGSNPILFVGFGLRDEDLMRSLRTLSARTSATDESRPVFALLAESEDLDADARESLRDQYDQLQDRFGVHVVPYPSPAGGSAAERSEALCNAIHEVRDFRLQWRSAWLEKPLLRKPSVVASPPAPYIHYGVDSRGWVSFAGERIRSLESTLRDEALGRSKAIVIYGPGGTGKSWITDRLIYALEAERGSFDGYFFWSSYYSNDSLTALDRVLEYLDRDGTTGSRIERLAVCMSRKRYLLVFDGFERFLQESDNPLIGTSSMAIVDELLEAILSPTSQSTVVITSRLWPSGLGEVESPAPGVVAHRIPFLTVADVSQEEPFRRIPREDVSSLCSLLDGHAYALVLAGHVLAHSSDPLGQLRRMSFELSSTPPDRRVRRMIRIAIEEADQRLGGHAQKLLEYLSLFAAPASSATVAVCKSLTDGGDTAAPDVSDDPLIRGLLESRLLHMVVAGRHQHRPTRYTVHPIVRAYLYQTLHPTSTDAVPAFTLTGFTAVGSGVDPGDVEHVAEMRTLIQELCAQAEIAQREGRVEDAMNLCRGAFGAIRSRMELTTAPRWCNYDEYLVYMIRLVNLARSISPGFWTFVERNDIASIEDESGPLYAEELAWVYNEIGLTCYAQGFMIDALAVWDQGFELNKVIEGFSGSGAFLIQSHLNLAAGNLNYGQIDLAERWLRDAERQNYRLKDKDFEARINGYRGVVHHLRGEVGRAEEYYRLAIEGARTAKRNVRAECIFRRHYADLLMNQRKHAEAESELILSRALAETGNFPELVAWIRLSHGHWYRVNERFAEAIREFDAALASARETGRRLLESETLSELSRLALDLGDAQIGRQRAIESLLIANDCVLGLKQTHDLVGLGRASKQSGQARLGDAYLKHAKDQARRQQYWLRYHDADQYYTGYAEASV